MFKKSVVRKFKLDPKADTRETCGQGCIDIAYADLERAFGVPTESDGCKISGEWVFTDQVDNVYTLFDWKVTNLYNSEYPSVEEFRNQTIAEFQTGGGNPQGSLLGNLQRDIEFRAWIVDMVKQAKKKPPHKNIKIMRKAQAVEQIKNLLKRREDIQEQINGLDVQRALVDGNISTFSRIYGIKYK
jgi:hypothetical protein